MTRTYFSKGCRGNIVVRLQRALQDQGFAPPVLARFADGDYGEKTATAVRAAQKHRALAETGQVDADAWTGVMQSAVPSLFERVLQLTADFEGHGFELAQGNFDGAGLTWGIIGFTLQGGELKRVIEEIDHRAPGKADAAFGDLAESWRDVLALPAREQVAWADTVSIGKSKAALSPPWKQAFARLGALDVAQQVQVDTARRKYFEPALKSAKKLGLATERGIALCFDTHVQSGSVKASVFASAQGHPQGATEGDRLPLLANAIADAVTKVKYRPDVLSRRMCIATGGGAVHGAQYKLASWGLGLHPSS